MMTTTGSPIEDGCEPGARRSVTPDTNGGPAGLIYATGVVGAAVYWIQEASSFGDGVVGALKALVWPGFLVYEALRALGA